MKMRREVDILNLW